MKQKLVKMKFWVRANFKPLKIKLWYLEFNKILSWDQNEKLMSISQRREKLNEHYVMKGDIYRRQGSKKQDYYDNDTI